MTLFERDLATDARLHRARADFVAATEPERASPALVVLGVLRAGAAVALVAAGARRLRDPIALEPRVLRA